MNYNRIIIVKNFIFLLFVTRKYGFLDFLFVDDKQPLGMLLEQELEDELKRSIDELPLECRRVFYKSRFEQKSMKK